MSSPFPIVEPGGTAKAWPMDDGTFTLSDEYWLPGTYDTKETAWAFAKLDDAEISRIWQSKANPDGTIDAVLTMEDLPHT